MSDWQRDGGAAGLREQRVSRHVMNSDTRGSTALTAALRAGRGCLEHYDL
jgi:hypothetical protein